MLNAIDRHIDDANSCELGCAALGILVVGEGKCIYFKGDLIHVLYLFSQFIFPHSKIGSNNVIDRTRAVELLTKVITTHNYNPGVCQNCCTILKYILLENCKKSTITKKRSQPSLHF